MFTEIDTRWAGRRSRRRVLRSAVGAVDAFLAPHGFDRYIELVRPMWSTSDVRARIIRVERTTPRTVTLTLRPNRNWAGFTAGQHTQLTVEIDGRRQARFYSMANAARTGGDTIELSITEHPDGLVSRHLRTSARPGLVVGLSAPQGTFVLPAEPVGRLLLISGGSGITPVISMLRTLCDQGAQTPVTFVHYALTEVDMLYREELRRLAELHPNVRVVRIFTDEPGHGDLDGFLTPAQLEQAEPSWADADAYVCGPAPLMDAARTIYESAGLGDHVFTEAFTLAGFVVEAGPIEGSLRFSGSAVMVTNDGRGILAQAEAAGLSPQSGCRMGICHTCVRPLNSGVVRNAVTGELISGPAADVQICVNVPVGDVDVDL